jgi:hypothetical protein
MDLTPQQLKESGLTPEEGSQLARLVTKLEENHQVMAQNNKVAQKSFGEWLSDVLPKVGKALGMAANVISNLLRSVAAVVNAFGH